MKPAQLALEFLLAKEQFCEEQDLFIISYIIPIVSLLDQSENFNNELKKMVHNNIEQDKLNDEDITSVLLLVDQLIQLT
tara:strand:+ start:87 stop:323 length:237 start_codon:yes stop_codon:yes gene_type:complete